MKTVINTSQIIKEENVHTFFILCNPMGPVKMLLKKPVCVVCYCGFKKMECISQKW